MAHSYLLSSSIDKLPRVKLIPSAQQAGFETTKSALALGLLKMLQPAAANFNYISREFKWRVGKKTRLQPKENRQAV